MEVKDCLKRIKELIHRGSETGKLEDHLRFNFLHAIEELGEVVKEERKLRHGEGSTDALKEEVVDLIITGFATFCSTLGTEEEFDMYFEKKCNKWDNNLKKIGK